jgi:xanthine dehydrogenase YagT iron-sulfur-binding subunit
MCENFPTYIVEEFQEPLTEDEAALLSEDDLSKLGKSRRNFLGKATLAAVAAQLLLHDQAFALKYMSDTPVTNNAVSELAMTVKMTINGASKSVAIEPNVTLLDALRERLQLFGTKKGCDHGQCGACTVIIDGKRVLSCLTLAAQAEGQSITTIEGLANGDALHPMQEAFITHDGFQCGYCTPGQICSAVALLDEAKRGEISYVSTNISKKSATKLSDNEIRERMSGNICRCGAYPHIVEAIKEVQTSKAEVKS